MKTNTTKNLASVAMLVILSPFLLLAMIVSVKTAGIAENNTLLLLLTLTGAVLSGVNGFGRRTAKAIPPTVRVPSAGEGREKNITWSTRQSHNA